jgi:hypothetical protein
VVLIASEALPNVQVATTRSRMSRASIHTRATAALRRELELATAPVTEPSDEVVLPLVADDTVLGYRLARELTIDGGADGKYLAYADASTGEVLAVQQMNAYATGTVLYHAVDRYPSRVRIDRPAPLAYVTLNGSQQTTSQDGSVSWSTNDAQTVSTGVIGDLVKIVDKASGVLAVAELALAPGGQVVWDASSAPEGDAQVQTYLAVNIVKDFVGAHLDPDMPKLYEQITANVNIAQDCNAFFDGKAINFFHASMTCQNTGLIQDVVFHEFGHAVHSAEIIDGVGKFDGAMSEGAADFLAASITGDHGMGRGFFYSDAPLRDLDPDGMEWQWPKDVAEIHHTGMIYGGIFWDLRKSLIAAYGETEGVRLTLKIYLATLRRATNIPSTLLEALVEDDDDGNLTNGTPHECHIRDAWARHGLRTVSGTVISPGSLVGSAGSTIVRLDLDGLSTQCSGDNIKTVIVDWNPAETMQVGGPVAGNVAMTAVSDTTYWGQIQLAREGKIKFRANVYFDDGSFVTVPNNAGDPYYELYQGHTVPLYCTDFETTDPFSEGWTTGLTAGAINPWQWGDAVPGGTDPPTAFSGTKILGQVLGGDYPPDTASFVKLPPVDVGQWSDVRLQYRRWLDVEDSHYDHARITVNGRKAWENSTANNGDSSAQHHLDREWRFQDVPLSAMLVGHKVEVGFDLTSDPGLELGGWQIDDLCIVANINSICGDGIKSPTEGCDDGAANADTPDTCRTFCQKPACGDGIVDGNEECDEGIEGTNACSPTCQHIEAPTLGGCCSANKDAAGPLGLGVVVIGLVLRRRRRR